MLPKHLNSVRNDLKTLCLAKLPHVQYIVVLSGLRIRSTQQQHFHNSGRSLLLLTTPDCNFNTHYGTLLNKIVQKYRNTWSIACWSSKVGCYKFRKEQTCQWHKRVMKHNAE